MRYVRELNLSFRQISVLFDDSVFGFVCGSVARKTAEGGSDIDFFICTAQKISTKKREKFVRYYKQIHNRLGLTPDELFPGELVSIEELDKKLEKAKYGKVTRRVRDSEVYDGIVWAGMLSSEYTCSWGDKSKFLARRKIAKGIVAQWKKELLKELRSMPPDVFLKHIIS